MPLYDISSSFAMEQIKYSTALPVRPAVSFPDSRAARPKEKCRPGRAAEHIRSLDIPALPLATLAGIGRAWNRE
ncbi:MAG: Transcriptional regulator, AsnC family [uncultured Caballeronia sp.]|nr:MAG: Transcriptional regulator, AsnC family [uncultured Caballeronia sp.]